MNTTESPELHRRPAAGLAALGRLGSLNRPVVATPQVVAVTTGILFSTAGLLVLLVFIVFPGEFAHVAGLRVLASSAVVVGIVSVALRRRLRPWVAHPIVLCGTALITAGAALAGNPLGSTIIAGLYILIAADSAFFFSWPAALAHQVVAVTACLLVTGTRGPGDLAAGLVITGSAALVAAVVGWLVRAAGAATTDPLTGLPNRRGLDGFLDAMTAEALRSGRPLSAAMIDIDRFKEVNDAGGHHAGDALLTRVVRAWQLVLGEQYVLTRPGGDEFAVLLPDCAMPAATELMQRLREATPEAHTCSIGVAQWDPAAPSMLLTWADQALYEAKRSGRNRVRAFGAHSARVAELRRALHDGELTVYYQPVVPLGGSGPQSAEALLRWQHPGHGLVPPAEFLPVIEDTDLMHDVGRFVLDTACAQAARWRSLGGPRSVGVNVTGRELLRHDYADTVAATLHRYELPPTALVLEVTEASLAADATPAVETLHRLRELGVQIAIDDFGTGYSGLGRLHRLPIDILKIDRSFVQEIEPGSAAAPFVQAILALAAALGLDVIAEGVETDHQANVLRGLGCPRAQGYLYARPAPGERWTRPSAVLAPAAR